MKYRTDPHLSEIWALIGRLSCGKGAESLTGFVSSEPKQFANKVGRRAVERIQYAPLMKERYIVDIECRACHGGGEQAA